VRNAGFSNNTASNAGSSPSDNSNLFGFINLSASPTTPPITSNVPEPSETLGTLFFGTLGAGYLRHRQSKKAAI